MFKSSIAAVSKPRALLALALTALLAVAGGCKREPAEPAAPDGPVETVQRSFQLLHDDDLDALVQLSLPPGDYDAVRAQWRQWAANSPASSEEDRAQFAQMMIDLTADGAEDRLYAQAEPSLIRLESELSAQLPLMVAMGTGFLSAGIQENPELSADQKQHANAVIGALAGWLATAPLADRDKARAAIAEITASARALDLQQIDQVRALSFEQLLAKLGIVTATLKSVLATYGLDLNASLAGAKVELIEQHEDTAQVRITYPLIASELSYSQTLVRRDDRWYGAELLDTVSKGIRAEAEAEAEAGVRAEAAPAPTR